MANQTRTLTFNPKEAAAIADALMDAAIALRTNHMTEVVIPEVTFLNNPEVSQGRKEHYTTLTYYATELRDFVRLS